jgi:hypothetical protein
MEKFNGHIGITDDRVLTIDGFNVAELKVDWADKYLLEVNDLKARNAELVECLKLFTKTVNYTENEYDVLQTKALKLIEKNGG